MIRLAESGDLPLILNIYEYARGFMAENGNPSQWGKNYPPEETVLNDIKNKNLYVIEEEEVSGVFFFKIGEDPTYNTIHEGHWLSSETYGTIHRIAGNGKERGILKKAVSYCEEIIPHLRIDTHEDNKIMQRAIEKNGFTKCGMIFTEEGSQRIAYEKLEKIREFLDEETKEKIRGRISNGK